MKDAYILELFKSLLGLIGILITFLLTWFVGMRFAHKWSLKQKRNELNLAAVEAFFATYGEFKELVKTWRLITKPTKPPIDLSPEERWSLLKRACVLESKSEALVLRIATEHKLTSDQLLKLGLFRQAMQSVRESLRETVPNPLGSRGVEYRFVNELASAIALLLSKPLPPEPPSTKQAESQLAEIAEVTSKVWEREIKNQTRQKNDDEEEDA